MTVKLESSGINDETGAKDERKNDSVESHLISPMREDERIHAAFVPFEMLQASSLKHYCIKKRSLTVLMHPHPFYHLMIISTVVFARFKASTQLTEHNDNFLRLLNCCQTDV